MSVSTNALSQGGNEGMLFSLLVGCRIAEPALQVHGRDLQERFGSREDVLNHAETSSNRLVWQKANSVHALLLRLCLTETANHR